MKVIRHLSDIDSNTKEGRLLFAALLTLMSESRTDKTVYQILEQLEKKTADFTVEIIEQTIKPPPEMITKEIYHEKVIKPPLGLIPKEIHDKRVVSERFMEVCRAISRYYNTGESINVEWIEEYNELIKSPTIAKYLLECRKVGEQKGQPS